MSQFLNQGSHRQGESGTMKIKFQIQKNQGICTKKLDKSGNFITGEINQGQIREFYFGFMINECDNLSQFLDYQYYISVISIS